MTWSELRNKFGGGDNRAVLNKIISIEIPGGRKMLDAITSLQLEVARPSSQRTKQEIADLRSLLEALLQAMDGFRDVLVARYITSAKKETHPPKDAFKQDAGNANKFSSTPHGATAGAESEIASIHAGEPAIERPPLSLDLLKSSTRSVARDNQQWTPPAALVEQFGVLAVAELSRIAGVSEDAIRRAHERLGVEPANPSIGEHVWTPAMDKLLGTRKDDELGKLWQRPGEAVRRRRIKLGVAATKITRFWSPELDSALLTAGDSAEIQRVANRAGVTLNAAKVRRSKLSARSAQK